MSAEEQYKQELKQSDVDHHKPTAGAMTGHIISNLLIHSLKINQASLFTKGHEMLFLSQYANIWIKSEHQYFNQLNRLLVENSESIPTTTGQFSEYTMLEQNGADKYLPGKEQLFNLIKDFDTQTLFITKAIQLAEKENWPELKLILVHLLRWIKHQIGLGQQFLGHELREGLYNEEDDDDF